MTTDLLPEAPTNGTANQHCQCTADGYCQRFKRQMGGRLREICRGENMDPGEAAKYRALWMAEATGQPVVSQENVVCPYRTTEALTENGQTLTRKCPSCRGNIALKLFGCVHPSLALPDKPNQVTYQDCNACAYKPKTGTRALILKNALCPGDVLAMSAAIYSLHRQHPGKFLTAVETTAMQLWEHNPDVITAESLSTMAPTTLEVHYPAVHQSNQRGIHFMQAYCEYLGDALDVAIPLLTNRPMLYLSAEERTWISQVQEITKQPTRFWVINAGHKMDYPTKAYGHSQWQQVVNILRGKVIFVQIGESGHQHKSLRGVIDLIGKTDTRQLVRLVANSDGVVGPVSFSMHLAAALEKPAVTVLGGREPVVWNSYPKQTLLHTIGALDCCRDGGCWKSRVVALGDNDDKDKSLCVHPMPGDEPVGRCMGLIRPEEIAECILRNCT